MKENEQNNEKRETVADILAKMVRESIIHVSIPTTDLKRYADRIEAAWEREREELDKRISDLEAYAKLWTGRADELRLKCDEFYAKAKPVGNAAAMREALVLCSRIICANGIRGNVFLDDIQEAHKAITAALVAPPRNCDVGTAEEQAERQKAYCRKHFTPDDLGGNCRKCPLKNRRGWSCQLAWAQMPYEKQEGAGEMSGDYIPTYTLTVEIQDNGIIRDPFGFIVGKCDDEWLNRMTNRKPYGLTVSNDKSVINWCGANYVRQEGGAK